MSEIVVVRDIADIRQLAKDTGFELNDQQGRPPLFAVAAHVKAQTGQILDFSEYGSKKSTGVRRVRGVKVEPTFTVRAVLNGVQHELVTTPGAVKAATGNAGKRGATSRNSYVQFAADKWGAAVTELEDIRIEESLSVPRVAAVPTVQDTETPVAEADVTAETSTAPAKRKGRAKKVDAVDGSVSDSEPVELDTAAE